MQTDKLLRLTEHSVVTQQLECRVVLGSPAQASLHVPGVQANQLKTAGLTDFEAVLTILMSKSKRLSFCMIKTPFHNFTGCNLKKNYHT